MLTANEPHAPDSSGAINAIAIGPDSQFLLTSEEAYDTELWDLGSGAQLYAFPAPVAGWSSDSQLVLTAIDAAQSWNCELCIGPQALRRLARTRVTRGFTAGERAKYLTQ